MAMKRRLMWQHQYCPQVILPDCYTKITLDNQLIDFYKQWKSKYLYPLKGQEGKCTYLFAYLEKENLPVPIVTTSEAMGFGLLAAVFMQRYDYDAQLLFNQLYRYITTYPSAGCPLLMAASQEGIGSRGIISKNKYDYAKTGAELDIAYALILAHKIWGDKGEIAYGQCAKERLHAILEFCVDFENAILGVEDWVQDISRYRYVIRSADLITAYFLEFAHFDIENALKWLKIMRWSRRLIYFTYKKISPSTGLMPEYVIKNGKRYEKPQQTVYKSSRDGTYFYEACTLPWRYSLESIIHPSSSLQIKKLNQWIQQVTLQNPEKVLSGYYIDGCENREGFGKTGELCFIAPFMVAACIGKKNQGWLNALWNYLIHVPIEKSDFMGNTLKLLSMIVASGNWYI